MISTGIIKMCEQLNDLTVLDLQFEPENNYSINVYSQGLEVYFIRGASNFNDTTEWVGRPTSDYYMRKIGVFKDDGKGLANRILDVIEPRILKAFKEAAIKQRGKDLCHVLHKELEDLTSGSRTDVVSNSLGNTSVSCISSSHRFKFFLRGTGNGAGRTLQYGGANVSVLAKDVKKLKRYVNFITKQEQAAVKYFKGEKE